MRGKLKGNSEFENIDIAADPATTAASLGCYVEHPMGNEAQIDIDAEHDMKHVERGIAILNQHGNALLHGSCHSQPQWQQARARRVSAAPLCPRTRRAPGMPRFRLADGRVLIVSAKCDVDVWAREVLEDNFEWMPGKFAARTGELHVASGDLDVEVCG